MNDDRLQLLLDAYFDGALTEEQRAELERILLSSPASRQKYWDFARLHADAARWGQEAWGRRMAAGPVPADDVETGGGTSGRPARRLAIFQRPRRWVPWFAAAAACISLLSFFLFRGDRQPARTNNPTLVAAPPATAPTGIAVLASSVDARWADGSSPLKPGEILPAGTVIKLLSGAAQVEFFSGTRLVLQGPVEIELKSEMQAFCRNGRISAFVPAPARGFALSSERLSVVDLGTEFGLNVPPVGDPEVHVFRGEVEVHPAAAGQTVVKLVTGEAGQFAGDTMKRLPAAPESFLREAEYSLLADANARERQAIWQRSGESLNNDPATLVHYIFPEDQFRDRTIANLAAAAKEKASSASIVGCTPAEGRWPLFRAIEFKGPGDRLRLDVGGSFKAVTLLAWVRFDALPNNYHALLAPDSLAEGTLRWGLTGNGELRLGIARQSGNPEPNWEVIMSTPVMTPERFGRWVLLASTFDGKAIHHYVDGQLFKAGDAYCPVPVSIGPAEVGNWRGPTPRFFSGRMDEFAIVSRAMTEREIRTLYTSGRPVDSSAP
jgi:hypothetical protein